MYSMVTRCTQGTQRDTYILKSTEKHSSLSPSPTDWYTTPVYVDYSGTFNMSFFGRSPLLLRTIYVLLHSIDKESGCGRVTVSGYELRLAPFLVDQSFVHP